MTYETDRKTVSGSPDKNKLKLIENCTFAQFFAMSVT